MHLRQSFWFIVVLIITWSGVDVSASALREVYITGGVSWNSLGDDFDGSRVYETEFQTTIMPDLNDQTALRVGIGWQMTKVGLEFVVNGSTLDAAWQDGTRSTDLFNTTFNVSYFFGDRLRHRLRTFIVAGFGTTALTVERGSSAFGLTRETRWWGNQFRIGYGLQMRPLPTVAMNVTLNYRVGDMTQVEGVTTYCVDEDININGASLEVTLLIFPGEFFRRPKE